MEESCRVFETYAEAGGNFIDTANRYTEGERFIREFVRSDRERFVLATKSTLFTRRGDPNASGNHRKNLVQTTTPHSSGWAATILTCTGCTPGTSPPRPGK